MTMWSTVRSFLAKPPLRRRLQLYYLNNLQQSSIALVVWLIWALCALLLYGLFADLGLFASLLLLGAIALFGYVRATRRLLGNLRRELRWEGMWQHDFTTRLAPKLRASNPLPLWVSYMARPEILESAWRLIIEERPKHILELGSGMSTLVMAYAAETAGGGDLTALENDANIASNTRGLIQEHGLSDRVRVLDAPLVTLRLDGETHHFYDLAGLPDKKTYDFVFIDGPGAFLDPNIRYPAMIVLRSHLRDNALILIDDTDRAPEKIIVDRWLARFPELTEVEALSRSTFCVLRLNETTEASGSAV